MTTEFGSSLLQRIGNTPLLRLERLTAHLPGIQIVAKAEWTNPGGSAKDRAAAAIVADAKQRGLLAPGKRLLDASSGSAGTSIYSEIGAMPVIATSSSSMVRGAGLLVAASGGSDGFGSGGTGN